jgi:formylglycine-generating enzyme required for sulfatase activity
MLITADTRKDILADYAADAPKTLADLLMDADDKQYAVIFPSFEQQYDTDPGLHAAAEWLLRRWNQEAWLKQLNLNWAKGIAVGGGCGLPGRTAGATLPSPRYGPITVPRSYVNSQAQTMVVIPGPAEQLIVGLANQASRKKRIAWTFALASKPLTIEEFRKWNPLHYGVVSRTTDLPATSIGWLMAAKYCNWLSQEEGIAEDQRCYEIVGSVTKLKKNWALLTGYRHPTEAEMEFAIRAGAVTARFFGETEELLPKYAWYQKNSENRTWPAGLLKPNDLGLFDVEGNVFNWCKDSGTEASDEDREELVVDTTLGRVLRGASFSTHGSEVCSDMRHRLFAFPFLRLYGHHCVQNGKSLLVSTHQFHQILCRQYLPR